MLRDTTLKKKWMIRIMIQSRFRKYKKLNYRKREYKYLIQLKKLKDTVDQ